MTCRCVFIAASQWSDRGLRDGTMSDGEMESFIERLGNDKKRSLDEVRDFSFARAAWKDLESGK
jgi:hypothetical protein